MSDGTVDYERLCALSGYDTPGGVRGWMARHGIAVLEGKRGRPATTVAAVNLALGIVTDGLPRLDARPAGGQPERVEF